MQRLLGVRPLLSSRVAELVGGRPGVLGGALIQGERVKVGTWRKAELRDGETASCRPRLTPESGRVCKQTYPGTLQFCEPIKSFLYFLQQRWVPDTCNPMDCDIPGGASSGLIYSKTLLIKACRKAFLGSVLLVMAPGMSPRPWQGSQ